MSENNKFELSPSVSILIAGVIIAGAIVFVNMSTTAPVAADISGPTGQQAPTAQTKVSAPSAQDRILGSKDAPLVLIEYSDFECPYCNTVHPTLKRIVEESNGKIAWVYRHFPLESIHQNARPAAVASECVAEQLGNSGFWKFADAIFADQSKMSAGYYAQLAVQFGADKAKFDACVASGKFTGKIDANIQEAINNGGQGTPYTVLYNKSGQVGVSGALPYETFMGVIKSFQSN